MRIHKIQFKNINNLKGEHTISFSHTPLSNAGIFAIVGPTGSGKSTILDVITLALFNRIPRFKKAISKNEIVNEGSVITHHTTEAAAAITYEIKGRKYKSSWSVTTNRNGKLKDYEMTFYNPDGSIADLKRSEVPEKNQAIIGLKYDQFVKSILLSQGEFSKFLKADKNERGALLENLTGTSIYRVIGQKAYEKYKAVKAELDQQQEIIGVLSTLDKEKRLQLETELKASKKQKATEQIVLDSLAHLQQVKTDIATLKSSLTTKQEEAQAIKNQSIAFKTDQKKLDLHQKLSPIQGPLATYTAAVTNAQKSQENLKQYQSELADAQKKHQSAISEMAELTKLSVEESSFKKIMNDFETEINNADRDIKNLLNNGKEARVRINKQKTDYPLDLDDNISPKDAITILTERATEITALIKVAQLDASESVDEVKKELKQKQTELEELKQIQLYYVHMNELQQKKASKTKALQEYNSSIKTKTPLSEKCKALIESTESQIVLLRKQKEDAIKITELEEFRKALMDGSPCPLCGSTEHPYAEHNPAGHKSEIDEKIKALEADSKKYQLEIQAFNKELTEWETSAKLTQELIEKTTQEIAHADKELKKLLATINKDHKIEKDKIASSITKLAQNNHAIEAAIEAIIEAKLNKGLIEQFKLLQTTIEQYKSLRKERNSKFDGADVNSVTNKLQDSFEKSKSKMTELSAVILKETDSLKRDTDLVTSIGNELKPKITKLGFSDLGEISAKLLDEATFTRLTQQRDKLSKLQTSNETEIKTLRQELDKKQKADDKPELTLAALLSRIAEKKTAIDQHQHIFSTNLEKLKQDDEQLRVKQAKEQAISALKQELEKWSLLNKMIGDATGNTFANFAQGLTLQNLLVYANRRLTNLSDRYLLSKPENDGALTVIDKYQGNTSRSVTTLSGGESFLISLALALSLSDMASKNVALECLFIDEGFGTLDPDTLELAMTTLEKLQSESQKTVGVISHVEALKERIHVQIKLNKNAQGYSQIEIAG